MRRNSLKLTALAAMALAGGAVGLNCSKSSNPNSGDVKLAVVLPSGATLTTINYKILSSSSAQLAAGSFNVSDPHATVSLDIVVPVTPAGNAGDTVNLTATSSSGESCTGTSAPFPVLAGTNPAVTMTLTCGTGSASGQTGNIGITATLVEGDNCPSILSAVVGPDETSVGGQAMVIATASDPDANETLTYAWAPAANFTAPGSSASSYTCTASGTQTFTLTVSDSHVPSCQTVATLTIKCDNVATCGNNVIEPGETCDPPNGTTCGPNCQTIGGTGGVAGTTGTGGTGTGGVAGTTGTGGTGTGGVAGMGVAGSTGTGGIATGGTTGTGGIATGGATGSGGDPLACITCERTGTSAGICAQTSPTGTGTTTSNTGCDGFTNATDKANCYALLTCLRGTQCRAAIHSATADYGEATSYPQAFDDPHPCLCGNIPLATCVSMSTGFTGVCAPQFVAGAAADSLSVGNAYISPTSGVGVAVNLSLCDIDNLCGGATGGACGVVP